MDEVVEVEVRHTHGEFEIGGKKGVRVTMTLHNKATGERLDNEEILSLFNQCRIKGVHIKDRYGNDGQPFRPSHLPSFGLITGIEEGIVSFQADDGKVWRVGKDLFLQWYQLD